MIRANLMIQSSIDEIVLMPFREVSEIIDLKRFAFYKPTRGLDITNFIKRGFIESEKDPKELIRRARKRLLKSYNLLAEGLEDEAGEEAWRAVVDALNAVAVIVWGREVKSHDGLYKLVEKLAEEKLLDVTVEFGNAVSLHKNYYDPNFGVLTVVSNINQVKRLIYKVEDFINKSINIINVILKASMQAIISIAIYSLKEQLELAYHLGKNRPKSRATIIPINLFKPPSKPKRKIHYHI